jgi:hypothetical protein
MSKFFAFFCGIKFFLNSLPWEGCAGMCGGREWFIRHWLTEETPPYTLPGEGIAQSFAVVGIVTNNSTPYIYNIT